MADTCKTTKKYLPLGENKKKNTKTTDSEEHRQKVVLLMELNA